VGEAPGATEARNGKPFVGASGQLLDQVLDHHGIDRASTWVDNVCACRPSDNRTPEPDDIKACYPRLLSEIASRPVDTVVTLGNTATQAVLQTSAGITQVRVGPPKDHTLPTGQTVRVVPTFHPAACLYAPDNFPTLVRDLGKVVGKGADVAWAPPVYKVFDDPGDALCIIKELWAFDDLVVDIETGIEKDVDFDHPERYQFLCVGIGYTHGKVVVIGEEALKDNMVRYMLLDLLRSKRITCQNGKFDLAGLTGLDPDHGSFEERPKLYFDTMLASYCLDERGGIHSLEYQGREILGAPDWKSEIAPYLGTSKNYAVIPRPILYKYNAYDCHVTWLLKDYLIPLLDEEGLRPLHDFLCRLSDHLIDAEMFGIGVDAEYLDVLTDEYVTSMAQIKKDIQELVKDSAFNPNSPQQVKKYLNETCGLRVTTTDKDQLKKLQEMTTHGDGQLGDFVRLMLVWRREAKMFGTYVKGTRIRMHNGRVHSTFKLHGTQTGRLASANPNMHNVPRESKIKRLFVPGPGSLFIQGDYKTAELRVMCLEGDDPMLRVIFEEERDLHDEFSLVMWGPDFTKDQRVRTKAFIFGSPYGREPYSIADELRIPVSEAEILQKKLFDSMPGVMEWRDRVVQTVKDNGELVTCFGRRRRFHLLTNNNMKDVMKEAWAFIPQSTVSDITQHAFMQARMNNLNAILTVHDSVVVECPEDEAEEQAKLLKAIMEATAIDLMGDDIPFPVDIGIGKSLGDIE
jgi:uracil-DNA glycosylase family 4